MSKKYEILLDTEKEIFGVKLYRIKALISFGIVKEGEIGGYVGKENNLSQSGNAWVSGDAQVSGDAWVCGNAQVSGDARVYGDAWVYGNARVYGNAQVYGNARVSGDAWVYGNARVYGNAQVYGDAQVSGNAWVYGNAQVSGDARVYGDARVSGDAWVCWFSKFGSSNRTTTAFKNKNSGVTVTCGCFIGTLDEFEKQVNETHKNNDKYRKEYLAIIEVIKIKFEL